jgi:integrase
VREAKWLAAFVRMEFEKDMEKIRMTETQVAFRKAQIKTVEPADGDEFLPMDSLFIDELEADCIMVDIRKRYDELLSQGKSLIKTGIADYEKFKVNVEDDDISVLTIDQPKREVAEDILRGFTDKPLTLPKNNHLASTLLQECLKANQQLMQTLIEYENNRDKLTGTPALENLGEMIDALSFKGFQMKLKEIVKEETLFPQKADMHYSLKYQYSVFRDEKAREISIKSIEKYDYAMSILKAELGEGFDCRKFNKIVTQKIKTRLIKQKKNAGVGEKGLSIKRSTKPISAKTINMLLSNYRVFMTWFIDNNDVHMDNPFTDVSVKANKRELIKRRPFERAEIMKLLDYQWAHGSECRGYREDTLCFTKVGLYSGMRLNEIASLRVGDVKQIDGVWVFDLTEKKLKSWNSQRTVPIAQYLLELGMLERVAKLKKQKKTFLFSDMRSQSGSNEKKGYGEPVSRWFNRTALKNMGIDKIQEQKKGYNVVFHCLRNTFITELVSAGEQHHHITRVVGHAQDDDVTLDSYADVNKISLMKLKKMMDDNLKWHR